MSRRERRLWVWTGLVVVGIFATLGLARTFADELRRRGLFDALFAAAALTIAVSAVAFAWRVRLRGIELGVLLGVVAVAVLVVVRMSIEEERTHLVEYAVVALLVYEAASERWPRRGVAVAVVAVVTASAIGALDEGVQLLLPDRVFDPADIAVNAIAATLAVIARVAVGRAAARRAGTAIDRRASG